VSPLCSRNATSPAGLQPGNFIFDRSFHYGVYVVPSRELVSPPMSHPKEFNPDEAIEKAMQVFWHKGYEATSMEDLLTAMDLNRGSLYDTLAINANCS